DAGSLLTPDNKLSIEVLVESSNFLVSFPRLKGSTLLICGSVGNGVLNIGVSPLLLPSLGVSSSFSGAKNLNDVCGSSFLSSLGVTFKNSSILVLFASFSSI